MHLLMLDANARIAETATGPEGWPRTPAPGCTETDSGGWRMLQLEWQSRGEDRGPNVQNGVGAEWTHGPNRSG